MLKTKISRLISRFFGPKPINYWRYFFDKKYMKRVLISFEKIRKEQIYFPEKVGLIFIGTNKYIDFFPRYYNSVKKNFLPNTKKEFFVFTDVTDYPFIKNKKDVHIIKTEHKPFPYATLLRFRYINRISTNLKKFPFLIYLDADMFVNLPITEDEFFCHKNPLFGVRHPNFVKLSGKIQLEKNPLSTAFVSEGEDTSIYWQGCFWGGTSSEFLKLSEELEKRIDIDLERKLIAKWYDESQLNKYFIENKRKVFTYPLSYACGQNRPLPKPFKKKIIHMHKKMAKIRFEERDEAKK